MVSGRAVGASKCLATRPWSSTQVTYNGSPLCHLASDSRAGVGAGDGVAGFTVAKP